MSKLNRTVQRSPSISSIVVEFLCRNGSFKVLFSRDNSSQVLFKVITIWVEGADEDHWFILMVIEKVERVIST